MIETSIIKWIKKKIRMLIGIVEDGDTATHSIAAEKYVVWKGDLYKASTAIAIGTTLSTSNLTAVSDGGLNEINGNLANKDVTNDCIWNNGFSYAFRKVYECGQYYIVQISATSNAFVNGAIIVTLPKNVACSQYMTGLIVASSGVPTGAVCIAMTSQGVKTVTVNISGAALNGYIVLSLLIPKQ